MVQVSSATRLSYVVFDPAATPGDRGEGGGVDKGDVRQNLMAFHSPVGGAGLVSPEPATVAAASSSAQ